MTIKEDINEIKNRITQLESLKTDVAIIKTNLGNHLKHHMEEREWKRWIIPCLISCLMILERIIGG